MTHLRTVEFYRDDKQRLFTIQSVRIDHAKYRSGCYLFANIIPLVVILCTVDGSNVIAVDADNAQLDKLRRQHPGLDELIARACQ